MITMDAMSEVDIGLVIFSSKIRHREFFSESRLIKSSMDCYHDFPIDLAVSIYRQIA